jgi:hypothetical protein
MRIFLTFAAFMLGLTVAGIADNTFLLQETVSLPGASAKAAIWPDPHQPGYRVDVVFKINPNTPLDPECLSIYRDIRYDLRDGHNRTIAPNEAAMRRPVEMEYSVFEAHSAHPRGQVLPTRAPCSIHTGGEAGRYLELDELYPHLVPGMYTLYMTFAPRGISQQASFKPVHITVDAEHPI